MRGKTAWKERISKEDAEERVPDPKRGALILLGGRYANLREVKRMKGTEVLRLQENKGDTKNEADTLFLSCVVFFFFFSLKRSI